MNVCICTLAKPSKLVLPSQIFIPYNSVKKVRCHVHRSNPRPEVHWFKQIKSNTRFVTIEQFALKTGFWESTLPIKWSDGPGIYECQAFNLYGLNKATIRVVVGSKPSDGNSTIYIGVSSSFGIVILVTCICTIYCKYR